jgi:hypothetical protein
MAMGSRGAPQAGVRNDGGHLCGPTLPQLFAVGPSKGTVGLTTSGPGRTLSSIVPQHLLQQRSPDRRVGEHSVWQVHARDAY